MANPKIYEHCNHLKWTHPDNEIDDELREEITLNYRTLPSFENTVFERKYIKHYSLQRHELLKCRWQQYKGKIEERVIAPFQFPNNRDLHFHNGTIRFLPSMSIYRYPDHRMKLRPGPGVDIKGQMPIPQELLMKRSTSGKFRVVFALR